MSMKPILIHTHHFPPRDYSAITLFPFVFYNSPRLTDRDMRHEMVHIWQQLTLLVVFFYLLYFIFWLVGLLRFRSHNLAYRNIPFERSAYRLEVGTNVHWSTQAFDWLRCLK